MELVSVIIPVYNIELYVGQCIESVIKQKYSNLEIIVVDDGSTDRSGKICDLYASKDERIKVIHKENGGLVSARKAGLRASTGDYIANIDGDDWIEKDYIESMMRSMVDTDADVVIAGFSRDFMGCVKEIDNGIDVGLYEGEKLDDFKKRMISNGEFFRYGITTYLWNKVFKRDIIEPFQLMVDEKISVGEDAAVTYPVLEEAKVVSIIDNHSYHYRQREDSMLKGHEGAIIELEKISKLENYLMDILKTPQVRKQAAEFIVANKIMRSGAIRLGERFVFEPDLKGKRIAIVLAGTFGQMIKKYAEDTSEVEVVGWLDEDYWEYRRIGMDVDPFERISDLNSLIDYFLIAKVEPDEIDSIKKRILSFGVEPDRILQVTYR